VARLPVRVLARVHAVQLLGHRPRLAADAAADVHSRLLNPRPAGLWAAAALAVLLGLGHKAGLVAVALIAPAFLLSLALKRWTRHSLVATALLLMGVAAVALASDRFAATPLNLLVRPATRLAFLAPLALAGFLARDEWMSDPRWKAMLIASVATVPLLFAREMYGALLALPFAAFAAAAGVRWLRERGPSPIRWRFRRPLSDWCSCRPWPS